MEEALIESKIYEAAAADLSFQKIQFRCGIVLMCNDSELLLLLKLLLLQLLLLLLSLVHPVDECRGQGNRVLDQRRLAPNLTGSGSRELPSHEVLRRGEVGMRLTHR